MNFKSIVRPLVKEIEIEIEIESRPCPDQYVGLVGEIRDEKKFSRKPISSRPDKPALILILESPHIKEFDEKLGSPGPAKGPTGTNIAKYITEVYGLENAYEMPLLLINAVQYQCSLGKPTKEHRDEVFQKTWEGGGRSDFVDRMSKIYQKGDILVCACTKGNLSGGNELRRLVYLELLKAFPQDALLRRCHPTTWNIPSRRVLVWDIN